MWITGPGAAPLLRPMLTRRQLSEVRRGGLEARENYVNEGQTMKQSGGDCILMSKPGGEGKRRKMEVLETEV